MGKSKHCSANNEHSTTINIDVTKIVKYSCISSVAIVFIVFLSNTIKHIIQK